jgi:hypothetical protein
MGKFPRMQVYMCSLCMYVCVYEALLNLTALSDQVGISHVHRLETIQAV